MKTRLNSRYQNCSGYFLRNLLNMTCGNVKLLLFWLFNRWNSTIQGLSKFSVVGGRQCSLQCNCIGKHFVVWHLTLCYCWCRWLCWSECLHLQMQQYSMRKCGMYCHVWSYSWQLCCSMPWFVTAHHSLASRVYGRLCSWLNCQETDSDADLSHC